jgi:hypothetical protein
MDTRTTGLLLAAVVLLAGCTGSAGDVATTMGTVTPNTAATGTGTPDTAALDTTTTDNATTVETVSPATADLPPGVTESGVANASELLAANRRALSESDYAFRLVRTDSGENKYNSRSISRGTVGKQFAPYRIHSEKILQLGNRTSRVTVDTWGNESIVLMKYSERNRISYRKFVATENDTVETDPFEMLPSFAHSGQLSHSYVVAFPLLTGEFEVESVERRDGLTLTTLRATELNRTLGERDSENVSNYSATLVADERGRIHRANLTVEFSESTFGYDFRLTDIGGATVPYPQWADRALGTVTARVEVASDTATESFVVSNEAGQVLPAGSEIRVAHAGTNATLELADPLGPGEEVYVYFATDASTPTLAAEPPEPDEAVPLDGEYEIEVLDPSGNSLVSTGFGFESATAGQETVENATTTATKAAE